METKAAQWSKALIEEGVAIYEMNRKAPVLEELFLQLTGGESMINWSKMK